MREKAYVDTSWPARGSTTTRGGAATGAGPSGPASLQVDYKKNYKRVVNTAVTPNKVCSQD
jgi:hypothetical protein